MTDAHRKNLRSIMLIAWDFRRADRDRCFADCLRGAWRWVRRMAADTRAFKTKIGAARRVDFSASLLRSPIRDATRGQRYGGWADHQAAYLTSRIGR